MLTLWKHKKTAGSRHFGEFPRFLHFMEHRGLEPLNMPLFYVLCGVSFCISSCMMCSKYESTMLSAC